MRCGAAAPCLARALHCRVASLPRRLCAAAAASAAPPPSQQAERPVPSAARSVHVGNIPFGVPVADVAAALLSALAAGGGGAATARLVTRVAVSDYSSQGVTEFAVSGVVNPAVSYDGAAGTLVSVMPPAWPGAREPAPRKPRDAGKHNRGFALLCCASAAGAKAAAAALAAAVAADAAAAAADAATAAAPSSALSVKHALSGRALRVGGEASGRVYLREDVAAAAAAAAAAVAAADARREKRAPHRRRQRERAKAARDADLACLLRAAFHGADAAETAAAADSPLPLRADADDDDDEGDDDADAAAAAAAAEAAAVEALWSTSFSAWADATSAAALGALNWDAAPDAVDPCRGGGLDPVPGGRGARKRAQVESFLAVLRGAGLAPPGAVLVDFGAGTGNLTLPLAWALPQCTLVALDAKPESVARLAARASEAGLSNVTALMGRIEDYKGACDVALGLHVCGSGTDAVLAHAAAARAAFCVSPCCIGKVNLAAAPPPPGARGAALIPRRDAAAADALTQAQHPARSAALRARLTPPQFARLAAAADFSGDAHVDGYDDASAAGALPRAAKAAVESDRAAAAAEAGFAVRVVKLLQPSACVRNDLIVGWREDDDDVSAASLFVPPPRAPLLPLPARGAGA
jgi:hypothetical protein